MKLFFCILSLLSIYTFPKQFTTLEEFTEYIQNVPEYPDNDTDDWKNPDYTSFHKQMMPTFRKRIINWLRMRPNTMFPVELLAPLLKDVSDYLQKTVPEGRIVKKISVDNGAIFYIWGELNGAFHSLVRSLNELHNQGVIDNNLKIIKPLVHFVFAGDVPNKSPYLIETLFLILRLMQQNPRCEGRSHEKVFYLKGKQEDRQGWLTEGLGRELRTRLVQDAAEKTPLITAFSNFFNRLPLALYLMQEGRTGKDVEAVRISYFGPDYLELEESAFLYFFDDYSRPVISLSQKAIQETDISLKIRAYVYAGSDLKKRIRQRGLTLISKNDIKTEWAVFSSPTGSSRRLYEFFDDAFVRLDVKEELSKWTMTLFRRDVRMQGDFVQDASVFVLSGEVIPDWRQQKVVELHKELADILSENQLLKKNCATDQVDIVAKESGAHQLHIDKPVLDVQGESTGKSYDREIQKVDVARQVEESAEQKESVAAKKVKVEDDTLTSLQGKILKIGSTMDLSKGVKGLSDGYRSGMMLKLDEVNAAGGINGITFQLNVMDDMYEPSQARANVLEMIKDQSIDLLLAPLGTPTTKAYLDLIEQGKVLALFPIARSQEFRRPDLINIIQYQMSLKQEAEMVTRYVYEAFKIKKLVIFYQNDDFGIEPKDEIERLAKTDLTDLELLAISYERNNVSFKEHIEKIKKFKPDAIALQATSSVVEEFVRQIGPDFLHGKVLYGGSWLMVDQFLKSMHEKGLHINLISSVPNPEKSDIALAQEFRKAARAKNEPLNVIYFEGYVYMSLLAHAIKEITEPYSKNKIINFFQNLKEYDFNGLILNFNPETRIISQNAWIYSTKNNEWIQRDSQSAAIKKVD